MIKPLAAILLAWFVQPASHRTAAPARPADAPTFIATGEMAYPADYRQWVFLTSGLDINYVSATVPASGHSVFQNVFVNPSAYKAFLATGTWPDKTTLVLEIRAAAPKASIDKRGQTQTELRGLEVHVKDGKNIAAGPWGFYEFGTGSAPAKLVERTASCYTCHEAHAAVDTTFVQFYPTLLPLAESKKTLSPAYLKDSATPSPTPSTPGP